MLCPTCFGKGRVLTRITIPIEKGGEAYLHLSEPCPNLNCHSGFVHCCEGEDHFEGNTKGKRLV